MDRDCDIVIIGAGPAGSAAAGFLARAGLQVIALEAGRHPRHHVGESLLPGSIPILNRLGISSKELARRFQPKFGARFYDPPTDRLVTFGFDETPGSASPAYQVFREEFDALLVGRAELAGAEMWQDAAVESFDEAAERPVVKLRDGRAVRARFLVDASGREALIASKHRGRRLTGDYGRVGVYNYFADLPAHDALDDRYITMYVFDGGWVWLIPLRDGRTSVGIVYRDVPAVAGDTGAATRQEALFWHAVRGMGRLDSRLRAARATDVYRAISDYSFTVDRKYGPMEEEGSAAARWAVVGDAGGFLDPIFSSGVHLALSSADHASAGIVEVLKNGSSAALARYAARMDSGFQVFRAFVHRFYNRELVNNLFFAENKPAEMHRAITRILAGHVWEKSNPVVRWLNI